ncbi:ComEC/Rec2 family competence protein [Nocardioides sp. R-C-SC26]|uniref:ComEC/Rec2 family competence protein n=1 Tax=Nocardioides sp. R-C-SC26 TaxID=2870414 RepID=UPI001E506EC5|nr:ComEC/Rec2 family competence protein [Nocardioides sp. R-C-SC26]
MGDGVNADTSAPSEPVRRVTAPDLRMALVAVGAWGGALLALASVAVTACAAAAGSLGIGWWIAHRLRRRLSVAPLVRAVVAAGVVTGAVWVSATLRSDAVHSDPVARLADEGAAVSLVGTVTSDPRPVEGRFGPLIVVRLTVTLVQGRGQTFSLRSPVLVIGHEAWERVPLGAKVRATGVLASADDPHLSALLVRSTPQVIEEPDWWWRGAAAIRASLRESVDHAPPAERILVPALVVGDDAGLDPDVADDFATAGLTHLTAVSGTNVTLVVGFVLVVARWCRVRGRGLVIVGALAVVGFVLLARTEPSVLRAAVMGVVGLVALGVDSRRRALRSLGVAVVGLLLVQPSLATSAGFALSALATAGIVVLSPVWRDAMARWLPRWLAEAIAVPAAAQLACTPVIAALSGEVSLVAVAANLLVAPVVGPATVLGLAAGLVGLVVPPLGAVVGTGAVWCVAWIVQVAARSAALPGASWAWGSGWLAVGTLAAVCVVVALLAVRVLARPWLAAGVALVAIVVVAVRLPTWGWPDDDWVFAVCDVGQGDGLVLRAGANTGIVVDTGPTPDLVDACLDRLGIRHVPLVVLTHFHADHVGGLSAVLDDRDVGRIWASPALDPPASADAILAAAEEAGVLVEVPAPVATTVGEVGLEVLAPRDLTPRPGADGGLANDASLALLATVRGVRILLTGDLEPTGQAALAADHPGLQVDVLKVPHHGSRAQDLDWLASLRADLAVVSVGADNDYGHPVPSVLAALTAAGAQVGRTDVDGDLLVLATSDGPRLTHR